MSELDFSDFLHELHLEGPGFSWMSPDSIMHKKKVILFSYFYFTKIRPIESI